jgi:methionine synthase II (cobalamin-independent)
MREALARIVEAIPHQDLAIQWDLCFEVICLEYERGRCPDSFIKPHFPDVKENVVERARRMSAAIPADISLGFHLCYGDFDHKHFVEPEDLGALVDLSNSLVQSVARRIDWLHMPVPKNREDVAYFEPPTNLNIGQAKLYLGLVHAHDEVGTQRLIAAAQTVSPDFGVATECGMGRTPPEELESILRISRGVTAPLSWR